MLSEAREWMSPVIKDILSMPVFTASLLREAPASKKSVRDFFETGASLNKLAVKTGIDNMYLITGDIHSLASDNIKFTQKLKLFRHIMKLNKHHVIIDLGGGSHNNTIDTFLMADKMIVILEPEITAVENMYHFIKNALFRKLRMSLREYGFKEIVEQMWERRAEYNINSLRELMDCIRDNFSYVRDIIDKELSDFKIYIILNKIRSSDDIFIGFSLKSTFMKYLGVNTKFVGFVEYDDSVWRSIRERKPFMLNYSLSPSAKEVKVFTENLLQGKEVKLSRN